MLTLCSSPGPLERIPKHSINYWVRLGMRTLPWGAQDRNIWFTKGWGTATGKLFFKPSRNRSESQDPWPIEHTQLVTTARQIHSTDVHLHTTGHVREASNAGVFLRCNQSFDLAVQGFVQNRPCLDSSAYHMQEVICRKWQEPCDLKRTWWFCMLLFYPPFICSM